MTDNLIDTESNDDSDYDDDYEEHDAYELLDLCMRILNMDKKELIEILHDEYPYECECGE